MRVMVDTNVIVSALLFPESIPAKALISIAENQSLVLCDYIIDEIYDVVGRKRPDLISDVDLLLAKLPHETVIAPREANKSIADPKDAPILNAALAESVDLIVSGDRHFLALEIGQLNIISPSSFLRHYASE